MGLISHTVTVNGIEVPNAYFRIGTLRGQKTGMEFELESYKDREAFLDGLREINIQYISFHPDVSDDGMNFYRQAYLHLKGLYEFKDAIDSLEEGQSPFTQEQLDGIIVKPPVIEPNPIKTADTLVDLYARARASN